MEQTHDNNTLGYAQKGMSGKTILKRVMRMIQTAARMPDITNSFLIANASAVNLEKKMQDTK